MPSKHLHCPNCQTGLQPLRRSQDYFCRACYTSLVVIDHHWVQMMRANDRIPTNIPFTALLLDHAHEPVAKKCEHRSFSGPLTAS